MYYFFAFLINNFFNSNCLWSTVTQLQYKATVVMDTAVFLTSTVPSGYRSNIEIYIKRRRGLGSDNSAIVVSSLDTAGNECYRNILGKRNLKLFDFRAIFMTFFPEKRKKITKMYQNWLRKSNFQNLTKKSEKSVRK